MRAFTYFDEVQVLRVLERFNVLWESSLYLSIVGPQILFNSVNLGTITSRSLKQGVQHFVLISFCLILYNLVHFCRGSLIFVTLCKDALI